jgi:RHS repeat-associated protein
MRISAYLAMLGTLAGPLRLAWGSEAKPPARPSAADHAAEHLPTDAPGTLGARVRPARLTVLEGAGVDTAQLWSLFDGRSTGLDSELSRVRFRADLETPTAIDAVGVFGAAEGRLAVVATTDKGDLDLLPATDLSKGAARWNRRDVAAGARAHALTFEWQPARAGAPLRELEIWGRAPSDAKAAPSPLPDALFTGLPAGARELLGPEPERTIAPSTAAAAATFTVDAGRDPGAFERAFLVYELAGQPHFTAAMRSINGHRPEGRFGVSSGAKGGLQVEEIAPSWLRPGVNTVRFLPANDHDPASYRVSHLRVVGVPARPDRLSDDGVRSWAGLLDGSEATRWNVAAHAKPDARTWPFAGVTQPRALEVHLSSAGAGTLVVSAADGDARGGKVTVALDGLARGWHRVPLETLPPTTRLTLTLMGGKEAAATLTEIGVSGSPLPADEAPRLEVSYPLSGECVNHRVHVRGWLMPADGASLQVNGAPAATDALASDGAFALELGEKAAGGGAGKPFEIALESRYPSGAGARRTVAIGGCVDRPPMVTAPNGRPRQPKDDLGAPYGVTVHADSAAVLEFGNARLEIPAGAVEKDVRVTVRPLAEHDVAPLDSGMTNITPGGQAYRFGPLGMTFKKPVRMTLPYDGARIPQGFTENDARTFYYDEGLGRWEQVGLIGQAQGELVAVSEHFTDFIDATMPMPDHPGTQSMSPTSLKDIKLADPAAGVTLIEPPTANSSGAANLRFPIEVPPGRNGVQPSLAVTYSSESRNGWVGVGWDVPISTIQIDTRFGVPKYDGVSDVYMLDGQMLTPISAPSGAPSGGQYFGRRQEGAFDWIQRLGTGPTNFTWVVTAKSGVKSYFGETAASQLSDPTVSAGNIFKWGLSRMRDPFGNEMKVTYAKDLPPTSAAAPEPSVQLYPSLIDYTSNGSLAAAYHVDLVRGGATPGSTTCARTDVIIDGRAGFEQQTRCLLNRINVRLNSSIIRTYNLAYQTPSGANFQKSLLASIEMRGLDGNNPLYRHDFTYFTSPVEETAEDPEILSVYQPNSVSWANTVAKDNTPRTADGLTHTYETATTLEAHGGVGLPGIETLDIGGSTTTGAESTHWTFVDVNGDGLPDPIADDGLIDVSNLIGGADRTSVGNFSGQFTPLQTTNFSTGGGPFKGLLGAAPLSNVKRNVINLHGGPEGIVIVQGTWDIVNSAAELRSLADMNGDGFVDQVIPTSSGLTVRLNDGNNGFGAPVPWNNYDIGNLDCSLQNFLGNLPQLILGTIGQIFAPVTGVIKAGGNILVEGAKDTASVTVKVIHFLGSLNPFSLTLNNNNNPPPPTTGVVWQRTINPGDPACAPGPNNGCGGGLTIPVTAGDRIYIQVTPNAPNGQVVNWDPQLTYTSVNGVSLSAAQQALREPDGSFIYTFSQSGDFKPVGRAFAVWKADADGFVAVDGSILKDTTSDDVRVQVTRASDGLTTVLSSSLSAASTGTFPMAQQNIAVLAGDQLNFEVLSDLPIDPDRVQWAPVVTYQNYCRAAPTGDVATVCGDVTCTPPTSDVPNTVCAMAGDPAPEYPVPTGILRQAANVFYPVFRFQPGAATQTFQTTKSGPAVITGTFTKSAATAKPVVVAIQGVDKLFMKRVLQPSDVGNFSMAVTTPSLASGEQLFFTVYSDTDVSSVVSWSPVVEGAARAVNIRRRADNTNPDHSGVGIEQHMGGGFHGWSYGDWNGSKTFTEAGLTLDPNATSHDFFPLLITPPPPPPPGPVVGLSLGGLLSDVVHLGGRGVGAIEDVATGAKDLFISGVGKGVQLLGSLGTIASSLFCETDHPVRLTKTGNLGLSGGVPGFTGGFDKGTSHTTVELMDMNGDRFPDSVTSGGIRFNTGSAFEATRSTPPLPLGDPRSISHFSLHVGASANGLVAVTDGSGDSKGYMGVGVGLAYGIAATTVDLIDVNGDGLPDQVSSDGNGNLKVSLNFGKRFSAPTTWAGNPWDFQTVSSRQELAQFFGQGFDADSVRFEDTSSNNGGLNLGGQTEDIGFGAGTSKNNTMIRRLVDTVDVNGDGLLDLVMRTPGMVCQGGSTPAGTGCMRVKLNLGDHFDVERQVPLPLFPTGAQPGTPGGLSGFGLGTPDVLSFIIADGSAGDVSATVPIDLFFEVGGSFSWSAGENQTNMGFEDIDGDGTPDHVLKAPGNAMVFARLNASGKTNLLKSVKRPLGGSFDLDYSREGNKVDGTLLLDMPKNQWVLSQVTLSDGRDNQYVSSFDYTIAGPGGAGPREGSGHWARDEREEYGYGHVTTTRGIQQPDGTFAGGDGSRMEEFFFNHTFYEKGLLRARFEVNSGNGLMNGVLMTYATPATLPPVRTGRFFSSETQRVSLFYEGAATTVGAALGDPVGKAPKYKIEKRTSYDESGNLKTLEDWGDEQTTDDDIAYQISYLHEANTNITRFLQIDATPRLAPATLLRRRVATYDGGLGSIKSLIKIVSGGKLPATGDPISLASATTTFTHDGFGNLQTITDPSTYQLKYTYDSTTQSQITQVDDLSFGYSSSVVPDLRFHLPQSTTDLNGQVVSYTYDEFGRLFNVVGPTDQGSTVATIHMIYSQTPTAPLPIFAATQHKDVQAPSDPIETVTFADGLNRIIQTKKDLTKDLQGDGTTQLGMTVSGQVVFDARGRIAQIGQPGFSPGGTSHSFVPIPRAVPSFTLFTYDSLGRERSHTLPDGALTTSRYFITPPGPDGLGDAKKWLMAETIDANGNTTSPAHDANLGRRLNYADSRGNRVAVREYNAVGTSTTLSPLTTRYGYDPLDQLVTATDPLGNVTTAEYDSVGQMVAITSPDAGRTEYRYDFSGNLGAKQTPQLATQGKLIRYLYDFNRLKQIDEPTMPDVTYTYGGPTEKGNAAGNVAGRVKQVTSEGSTEQRTYDELGNINKSVTTLPNMSSSSPASVAFTMKYTYDWLGRMQTMTFPNWVNSNLTIVAGEGELVTYTYDRGGNLDKITGHTQTQNPQHSNAPRDFTYLQHIGYDEFAERTGLISGNGVDTEYVYDELTRRLTDANADVLGTLEQQAGRPATTFMRTHYDYDKVGNVMHLQNRVSVQPWRVSPVFVGPMDVAYTYDNLYQLKTLTGKYRPQATFGYQWSDSFTYDTLGNITKKAQSQDRLAYDGNVTPTSDPEEAIGQLDGSSFDHNVPALTYTLDYLYTGSRPHAASSINETIPNQPMAARGIGYDEGGNNVGNNFNGTARVQTWDEENHLKQVTVAGASVAKFRYNDAGERTKKQAAAGDSWYVNQYFSLLPGNMPAKHIFAGNTRVVSKTDSITMTTPVMSFYHSDNVGSTSYITNAAQDLVQHERYLAFGELWRPGAEQEEIDLVRSGNVRRNWTFTSKEFDTEVGLYYFGARYFDPRVAVWQSPDPILRSYMQGGPNGGVFEPRNLGLYTYAWNNPLVLRDPDGRAPGGQRYKLPPGFSSAAAKAKPAHKPSVTINPIVVGVGIAAWLGGPEVGAPVDAALAAWNLSAPSPANAPVPGVPTLPSTTPTQTAIQVLISAGTGLLLGAVLATGGRTFVNQLPGLLEGEVAAAARVGVTGGIKAGAEGFDAVLNSGTIKWVVTQEGELVVSPFSVNGVEISHAVLSGGEPVLAAGQAEVSTAAGKYVGLEITNFSGHFKPSVESLEVGKAAFAEHGIHF